MIVVTVNFFILKERVDYEKKDFGFIDDDINGRHYAGRLFGRRGGYCCYCT